MKLLADNFKSEFKKCKKQKYSKNSRTDLGKRQETKFQNETGSHFLVTCHKVRNKS